MHDVDTRNEFILLRTRGWSLARIAARLKVSKRTLVDWQRQEGETIRLMRAVEIERLIEKNAFNLDWHLKRMGRNLEALENEIRRRSPETLGLDQLYKMAALVRGEIQKLCSGKDPVTAALDYDLLPLQSQTPAGPEPGGNQNCTVSSPAGQPPPVE